MESERAPQLTGVQSPLGQRPDAGLQMRSFVREAGVRGWDLLASGSEAAVVVKGVPAVREERVNKHLP